MHYLVEVLKIGNNAIESKQDDDGIKCQVELPDH